VRVLAGSLIDVAHGWWQQAARCQGIAMFGRLALRLRFVIITGVLCGLTVANRPVWTSGGDWQLLSSGAHILFSGRALHAYVLVTDVQAGPSALVTVHALQAGPVSLVLVRLLTIVSPGSGAVFAHVLMTLELPALLWLAEGIRASASPGPVGVLRRRVATLVAGLATVPVWDNFSALLPHVDDGLALLCAMLGMLCVSRQRWLPAAMCVGLAAGAKPWAIGAMAILIGLSHHRVRALLVAVSVAAAAWLPFLLGDPRTLSAAAGGHFLVSADAPLRILHLLPTNAPPWQRTVEMTAILVAASLVAARRGWRDAFAAGMLARLLFECATFPYYDADSLMALAAADVVSRRWPWRTVATWTALNLEHCLPTPWSGITRLVSLVAILLTLVSRPRPVVSPAQVDRRRHLAPSASGPLLAS
jgi:hypothetical protein